MSKELSITISRKRVVALLYQYEDANISIGKIAENLHIDREEVLALLSKHNIDFDQFY